MAINTLPQIASNGGPHRCKATLRDDYGEAMEMRSQEITFNIITFQDKQEFIEWHKNTFKESILVDEYSPVKWVVGFTIHSKNRDFQGPPLLDFTKLEGGKSRFISDLKQVQGLENRYELTLHLDQVGVSDMGHYELRILNDGLAVLEPPLSMVLYVNAKPQITFSVSDTYYPVSQNVSIECSITSYPINATEIQVSFQNCTKVSNCVPDVSNSIEMVSEEGIHNEYSKIVNIGGLAEYSGYIHCAACSTRATRYECTQAYTPVFVTDLPTTSGNHTETKPNFYFVNSIRILC